VRVASRELPDRDGLHFTAANYRYLKSRTIQILRRLMIKNINRDKKIVRRFHKHSLSGVLFITRISKPRKFPYFLTLEKEEERNTATS
jgi:hypothetical protein